VVYDTLSRTKYQFEAISTYWQKALTDIKRERRLIFFLFVSLMPMLSLYLIASFSIINPRYQKNRSFVIIGITTAVFYTIASILEKAGTIPIFLTTILIISLTGFYIFKKSVRRYF
jgi:lipopolysaccharide export system permease protein